MVLLLICIAFLAYDNYDQALGVRVFDLLGALVLFALAAVGGLRLGKPGLQVLHAGGLLIVLSALIILAVAQGVIVQQSFSSVPFLLGICIYFLLTRSAIFQANADRLLCLLLYLSSSALILQFTVYQLTGHMYSLLVFEGYDGLRSGFADLTQRPTGLYIEPSSHGTTTIMLLWLYVMRTQRITMLTVAACVSLLLSQSVLAIVYLVVFILAYGLYGPRRATAKPIGQMKFLAAVTVVLAGLWGVVSIPGSTFDITIVQRVMVMKMAAEGVVTEGSFRDRVGPLYGGYLGKFVREGNLFKTLFGKGISSLHFQADSGANTLGWLLTSFGLVGTVVILVFVISLIGFNPFSLTFLLLMMFPYPLASYAFQWLVLAFLAVFKQTNISVRTTPCDPQSRR
jgi:hypothetical protein